LKAKTIKSILSRKHNEFINSIDCLVVKDLVKKNSIITGGCIVSMLLNEKVNDFDYYFTDKETTLKVAEYYVKKFNERTGRETEVREDENGRIKVFIESAGVAHADEWVWPDETEEQSTTEIDDGGNEDKKLDEIKEETANKEKYYPVFLSANAISLSGRIQIITRFYGTAEEIHSNYDFTHCTCYWTSDDNELVLPQAALEAILTKELIYSGSKYPLCSIMRSKKFIKRGWHINAGQYLKMALQLNQLDLLDINVLEDQLTGVDSFYFMQVISYLKERMEKDKEFKLDNTYLFEIINRIF